MRSFRRNRLVIPLLLSMILACAPWAISPTPTDAPAPSATATETKPAHSPDAILHNGIVLTMSELQPQAQAIAIEGERILAVGSNAEILAQRDPSTKVLICKGEPSRRVSLTVIHIAWRNEIGGDSQHCRRR